MKYTMDDVVNSETGEGLFELHQNGLLTDVQLVETLEDMLMAMNGIPMPLEFRGRRRF